MTLFTMDLDDGRVVQVLPLTYGRARLGIGVRGANGYDDAY